MQDWWIRASNLETERDAKGNLRYSRTDIARELQKDPAEITRVLGKRQGSSPDELGKLATAALLARDTILKLPSDYFNRILDRTYGPNSKRVSDYKAELAKSGRWFGGTPPSGYKSGSDHILLPDANARRIKRIYERLAEGEPYTLVSREEGLRVRKEILKSRVYLGHMRFKGQEIQGRHQPLISEDLWKRAQPWLEKRPHGVNSPPFALRFRGSKYVAGDPQQVSKIREAFQMRLKGAKIADIAKHIGLEKGRTGERLKDRRYVDAGVIDLATWQRVQNVRIVRPVAERLKLQGHQTEAKILAILAQGPATVRAISKKMGLTDPGVRRHLQDLRRAGKVSKEPRKWGPYRLLN